MAFNFDNEINKQLNSLEPEETDINIGHSWWCRWGTQSRKWEIKRKTKKEEKEEEQEENEMNFISWYEIILFHGMKWNELFHELIQKSYLEKFDFIKKQLLG